MIRRIIVVTVCCALMWSPLILAIDTTAKGEFIAKLIDFVEWPAGKATDAVGTITIACVGDSPLYDALKDAAARKSTEGIHIAVKRAAIGDSLLNCQLAVIGSCDLADLAKVLKAAEGHPILTVGNCSDFAKYGVMVNILDDTDGSKVKFEVNTITLREAGLKMNAQLLKLAHVI